MILPVAYTLNHGSAASSLSAGMSVPFAHAGFAPNAVDISAKRAFAALAVYFCAKAVTAAANAWCVTPEAAAAGGGGAGAGAGAGAALTGGGGDAGADAGAGGGAAGAAGALTGGVGAAGEAFGAAGAAASALSALSTL